MKATSPWPIDRRARLGTERKRIGMEPSWADPGDPVAISDRAVVHGLLVAAARDARVFGYAELLGALGHRFTRPKMRALCRTLDAIDEAARASGEPELAVLVVRESDGLPGQGWWTGGLARGHGGSWTGAEASDHVRRMQKAAFAYWRAIPRPAG